MEGCTLGGDFREGFMKMVTFERSEFADQASADLLSFQHSINTCSATTQQGQTYQHAGDKPCASCSLCLCQVGIFPGSPGSLWRLVPVTECTKGYGETGAS